MREDLERLNEEITACRQCPRLVNWREEVGRTRKRAFADEVYWAKPVPLFGDLEAERLIVGLAPAAHGANRTGRLFTGDRSGDWLFRALHRAGVANQAESVHAQDGLALNGVLVTAVALCAPPANRLTPEEISACGGFLRRVLEDRAWQSVLCLGGIAWDQVLRQLGQPRAPFGHGQNLLVPGGPLVVASYHVSQQNTFTGRLTEPMLDAAIATFLGR